MANIILAVLTGVLVAVTAYYAWQTHLTVRELRAARAAQVLPRIIPALGLLGAGNALLRVVNVGTGPALDVKVRIALEPQGEERRWTTAVVGVGEHHDFIPAPKEEPNGLVHLDALTAKYEQFRILATYKDALGGTYSVHEALDVRQEWESLKRAQRIRPDDHVKEMSLSLKRVAEEMQKWTDGTLGLRVFTTDRDSYERRISLRMAFDRVAREHAGASPDVVRDALRKAAAQLGEVIDPPEDWVEVISKDDDEGFVFRVPPPP